MSSIGQLGKTGDIDRLSKESPQELNQPSKLEEEEFKKALLQLQRENQLSLPDDLDEAQGIKFSNHAVDRMRSRGISYSPQRLEKLNQVVEKAAAKGAKEALVLTDDSALIVSVKNNTVVTVMDKNTLKDSIFTNIDSTVVI